MIASLKSRAGLGRKLFRNVVSFSLVMALAAYSTLAFLVVFPDIATWTGELYLKQTTFACRLVVSTFPIVVAFIWVWLSFRVGSSVCRSLRGRQSISER